MPDAMTVSDSPLVSELGSRSREPGWGLAWALALHLILIPALWLLGAIQAPDPAIPEDGSLADAALMVEVILVDAPSPPDPPAPDEPNEALPLPPPQSFEQDAAEEVGGEAPKEAPKEAADEVAIAPGPPIPVPARKPRRPVPKVLPASSRPVLSPPTQPLAGGEGSAADARHAPPPTAPASPGEPTQGMEEVAAGYLHTPDPEYPLQARRRRLEGTVILRVEVDEHGRPLSIMVDSGSGHAILDRAAVAGVRSWRFTPARSRGWPAASRVLVPIRFAMR